MELSKKVKVQVLKPDSWVVVLFSVKVMNSGCLLAVEFNDTGEGNMVETFPCESWVKKQLCFGGCFSNFSKS